MEGWKVHLLVMATLAVGLGVIGVWVVTYPYLPRTYQVSSPVQLGDHHYQCITWSAPGPRSAMSCHCLDCPTGPAPMPPPTYAPPAAGPADSRPYYDERGLIPLQTAYDCVDLFLDPAPISPCPH